MNYVYDESKGLIVALVPRYTERGNVVYIFYENGKHEISDNRLKYIINCYLKPYGCSLETKTGLSNKNDSARALPIAVTFNHSLVPLRVRKAKLTGDSVYGYFCHEKITYPESISRKVANSLICNNIEFEVMCTFENIKEKRLRAEQAQKNWQRLNGYKTEEMFIKNVLYDSYCDFLKVSEKAPRFTTKRTRYKQLRKKAVPH